MIDVVRTDLRDATAWDEFVRDHPEGTAFHLAAWGRAIEKAMGHDCYYLAAFDKERLVGVLPLAHVRTRLFGNSLTSNAFAVYGGSLSLSQEANDALDRAAWKLAEDLGCDSLEYRSQQRSRPDWLCKNDLYVTFKRPIDPDSEVNMKAIPRKQRAMVRKGIKLGLSAKMSRDVNLHYRIYSESVRNLGTPVFPKRFFQALLDEYGEEADILTVYSDDAPVASVLSLYFRDEVIPYYGGGNRLARAVAGNDFMYWALMDQARERGFTCFDFGRSKVGTGAFSFKKNWGFEPTPLFYEFRLRDGQPLPDINPLNPKYQMMIKTWRRLPLPVANLVGPMIARGLG